MVASHTPLPVIGVPVQSKALSGLDSLLSIVQMPAGVPVATVAIGNGKNAGLLAVQILGASDPALQKKILDFKAAQAKESRAKTKTLSL
jgi:5-(carboxyamino)imidazole ribonucleotide mutase